eukprot:3961897-Pyramimonas_sp.AAC.1
MVALQGLTSDSDADPDSSDGASSDSRSVAPFGPAGASGLAGLQESWEPNGPPGLAATRDAELQASEDGCRALR